MHLYKIIAFTQFWDIYRGNRSVLLSTQGVYKFYILCTVCKNIWWDYIRLLLPKNIIDYIHTLVGYQSQPADTSVTNSHNEAMETSSNDPFPEVLKDYNTNNNPPAEVPNSNIYLPVVTTQYPPSPPPFYLPVATIIPTVLDMSEPPCPDPFKTYLNPLPLPSR